MECALNRAITGCALRDCPSTTHWTEVLREFSTRLRSVVHHVAVHTDLRYVVVSSRHYRLIRRSRIGAPRRTVTPSRCLQSASVLLTFAELQPKAAAIWLALRPESHCATTF